MKDDTVQRTEVVQVRFVVTAQAVLDLDDCLRDKDDTRRSLSRDVFQALRDLLQEGDVAPGELWVELNPPAGLAQLEAEHITRVIEQALSGRSPVLRRDLDHGGEIKVSWKRLREFQIEEGSAVLDKTQTVVRSRCRVTTEGAIQEGTSTPGHLPTDFSRASLDVLRAVLVPEVPQAALDRLAALILEVRDTPPADKEAFVRTVNRILDAQNLRFRVGDGLARLQVKTGAIQYSVAGRGSRGLNAVEPLVERVPESYLRRSRGPSRPSGPE